MDEIEFREAIRSLTRTLSRIAAQHDWASVTHLLDHGEEGEAMDVMIAIVVRFNVPVTPEIRQRLAEIMAEFEFTQESRSVYRYAGDAEMLDRMTVVDEPS